MPDHFPADPRIIVALDLPSLDEARALVARIGDAGSFYKVGMELYAAAGMSIVEELRSAGKQIFLDLKFYDIAETVKRAVAAVSHAGVDLLTVHGSGAVMRAAVEGRGNSPLKLLAVTVLTSFDETDLADLGYPCAVQDLVDLRVRKAREAGVDGLVCSAREAARVRGEMPAGSLIVTPGVRSPGAEAGGQKRVATPREAIAAGATHLVVGRQVTRATDPRQALLQVIDEITNEL